MAVLYNSSKEYLLLKKYVSIFFRGFYSEISIIGQENIPKDKAVVFAPNHINALMDALAVAFIPPFNDTKVFMARADIFSNKKTSEVLNFLKIIPAYRIRDGYENLSKNQESFDTAAEVLMQNGCLCIMPEGNQGPPHQIRPLVKGIFRISFNTQDRLLNNKELVILPVGIDYGSLNRIRRHLVVNIGKPISILDYKKEYLENSSKAINHIKDELKTEMEKISIHIPSNTNFDKYELILKLIDEIHFSSNIERFNFKRVYVEKLAELENNDIRKFQEVVQISEFLDPEISRIKLFQKISNIYLFVGIFKQFFVSPFIITGLCLNVIPFQLIKLLRRSTKITNEGFFSSVDFVLGLLVYPLIYLIQAILILSMLKLSWLYIFLTPLQFHLGKFAYDELSGLKYNIKTIKRYILKVSNPEKYSQIKNNESNFMKFIF